MDIQTVVERSSSSVLFHGPLAKDAAIDAASLYGRLLLVTDSPKGLRKQDSKDALELHLRPPVSNRPGSLVLGPLDSATHQASDALLKMVEEPNDRARPFLWAIDVGSVSPTIRSRCVSVWSPDPEASKKEDFPTTLKNAVRGDPFAIYHLLHKQDPAEVCVRVVNYLAVCEADPEKMRLWAALRPLLGRETKAGLASALLGGGR